MISTQELTAAFDSIGARVRLGPMGLNFRVQPAGEPGIRIDVKRDGHGPYFDVRVNFTRVVDLGVIDLNHEHRRIVLSADDWGETLDAPPRVFICEVVGDELRVEAVTEPAA